ncbi:unnamed protein product, partial [Adineta steineri]
QVTRWSRNGTYEIVVAGTGTSGSDNQSLSSPMQTDLDANGTYIYIADWFNHRIQRWLVGANEGNTIVGISGSAGAGLNQLNQPAGVALDPNETYIYVADQAKHRVQRFILQSEHIFNRQE